MSDTTILTGFLPIIAAFIVAALGYVKNASSTSAEGFDLVKFGATVIVGGGVTVVMYLTGQPISSESIAVQVVAYSGLIVIVENGIKVITRGAVRIPSSWIAAFLPEATKASAAAVPASTGSGSAVPSSDVATAGVHDNSVSASNPASKTADAGDGITKIAVKTYPSTLTGVSPFKVQYFIACDPHSGVHAPVKAIVDHADGSAVEELPIKDGIVQVSHIYNYAQALTLIDNQVSQYYSKVFYPQIVVIGADGTKGQINLLDKSKTPDSEGASLIITVKDAAAVLAGKV